MKKQYAVLGLGRFGRSVALELEALGCEVVAVDNSMEKVQEISDYVSHSMCADVHDPEVMKMLGGRNLDGAVVGIGQDFEGSILATILAKEAGIPYVLAKANNSLHQTILEKVGADSVVRPEKQMGVRTARGIMSGNFADWIELSPEYSILEIGIPKKWVGKCLIELKVRDRYGINVVGVVEDGVLDVNIDPHRPLAEKSIIVLIGSNQALKKFEKE